MSDRIDRDRAEVTAWLTAPGAAPNVPSMTPLRSALTLGGTLRLAVEECLTLRKTLIRDGLEPEEASRITGEGLRQVWQGREQPWRYLCPFCRDTGWVQREVRSARVDRLYGPGTVLSEAFKCPDCRYWDKQEQDAARNRGQATNPLAAAATVQTGRR